MKNKIKFLTIFLILSVFIVGFIYKNKKNNIVPVDLIQKNISPIEKPQTENIFNYDSENSNDNIKFIIDNTNFELKRKEDFMDTSVVAKIGNKVIFSKEYGMAVTNIFKLNYKENIILVINFYSGGAHCCSVAVPYIITNDNVVEGKGLYLGNIDIFDENSFFIKDNKLFTNSTDDRFAYFEMDYADSGSMFFPTFYELTINPLEFVNRNDLFVDQYLEFYKKSQQIAKEMVTKENCSKDEVGKYQTFGSLVYRYSMGFFAKIDREKLKNELKKDWWCFSENNFNKIESDIYQSLTENNKSEDFVNETMGRNFEK